MSTIKEILNNIGYTNLRQDGEFYRARPLYRESGNSTSLRVHSKTGYFSDFSAGINGNLKRLICLTLNISDQEADKYVKGVSLEESTEENQDDSCVDGENINYIDISSMSLVNNFNFYIKRGIKKEVLLELGASYCMNGKMNRRIIFPVTDDNGRIIGLNGRHIQEDHDIKWKAIGRKSSWVFPRQSFDFIKKSKTVILVEGISDIVALYDAGIKSCLCLFGTKILKELFLKLISLNPSNIIISTNNEVDNNSIGNNAAKKIKTKLLEFFPEENVIIKLPPKKDFGEMSMEERKQWKKELIELISKKK